MQITHRGVRLIVSDEEAMRIVLERLNAGAEITLEARLEETVPRIGEVWHGQGGIYAGLRRGAAGESDYHLIVGPELESGTWDEAVARVKEISVDGHQDFDLGRRPDQSIAYGNVPELFQREWYWSAEQHASDSSGAWAQTFDNGGQDDWGKDVRFRARAFRRLPI